MATYTRVNGAGFTSVGTLYATQQHKAFVITCRSTSNGSNTAIDLRSDDGTVEGKIEQIVRELNPAMYFAADAATGVIHVIMDGHNVDADAIAARLERISGFGTDTSVVLGTSITVA